MLLTILAYLLMVTVLVAAHEFGHYIVAKKMGMDVEEFSIGMGPWKWVYARKNGTEFTLRAIPLGGFVRIAGMIPEEDGSETKVVNGFYSKTPLARIWTLLAGPAFSVLAGLVLLIPIWSAIGIAKPVNEPIIASASETGAAYKAGIRENDRILAIDGKPVKKFFDIIVNVRDKNGAPVVVDFERNGQKGTVLVRPTVSNKATAVIKPDLTLSSEKKVQSLIGISFDHKRVPLGLAEASWLAFKAPFVTAADLISRIIEPSRLIEAVGGPETMVRATHATINQSVIEFIELAGLISMSLAIFNMLPITPLDGGQISMAFAELLRRGRRLSFKTQNLVQTVGFSIVMLMFVSFITIDRIKWSQIAAEKAKQEALRKK